MQGLMRRMASGAALALLALSATGCNRGVKDENERLMTEAAQLRDQIGTMEDALASAERQRNELAQENSRLRLENEDLRSQPAAGTTGEGEPFGGIEGVRGEARPGEMAAIVEGDVLFDSGKVTLKSGAKQALDQIAAVLNSQYAGHTIRVEGHTDSDPIRKSEWKTNDRLSAERAMAVKAYLESKGVSGSRMYVAGFGPNRPAGSKAQSRRVEIVVLLQ